MACLAVARWGYMENHLVLMLAGLAALLPVAAAVLLLEDRRTASIGWQAWRRLAAALLMFGLIETGYRLANAVSTWHNPPTAATADRPLRVVTFAEAQGDPQAFAEWWRTYSSEWHRHAEQIQTFTPNGPVPYVFKPNTSRPFLRGRVSVNSLGLCDREVPREKGNKFRIVAMGSSHTQCPPIEASDTPWPAMLERLIRERVPSAQEIEVLNAGAAGYTIEHNLHHLQSVVLPLKPDMIVTYFGYNEFDRFREDFSMPRSTPKVRQRASILLQKIDRRFAAWLAEHTPSPSLPQDLTPLAPRLADCRLARAYREYLRIARREGIQLVVCNFNMAVDESSQDEVIRFYEQGFPNVRFMIEANRLNTAMLLLVVRPESGARLIDVQTELNGRWDHAFVDLVHLSETGKAQLAENVLRGIVDLLPGVSPSPGSSAPPSRLAERPDGASSRF
jgi:lysophospholipase L1-like esterase